MDQVAYELDGKTGDVSDLTSEVESLEAEFDGDSCCPYYNQQAEVIEQLERDYGAEAEDIAGDQTYKASDWQQAQTAYAYAIAYCAFNAAFEKAKTEVTDALEEFNGDVTDILADDLGDDIPEIRISLTCPHGWASHDRELEDGTMIWESKQLDGCNGMAKQVSGLWMSVCLAPKHMG